MDINSSDSSRSIANDMDNSTGRRFTRRIALQRSVACPQAPDLRRRVGRMRKLNSVGATEVRGRRSGTASEKEPHRCTLWPAVLLFGSGPSKERS